MIGLIGEQNLLGVLSQRRHTDDDGVSFSFAGAVIKFVNYQRTHNAQFQSCQHSVSWAAGVAVQIQTMWVCFQKYRYQTERATYQILKSTYAPKNPCLESKIDATKSFQSNNGFSWLLVFQNLGPTLGQFHHESDLSDVKNDGWKPIFRG